MPFPNEDESQRTSQPGQGRRGSLRAGSWTLSLLAAPLTLPILRALREARLGPADLRAAIGPVDQPLLHDALEKLLEDGAVAPCVAAGPDSVPAPDADPTPGRDPGESLYELRPLGRELLSVASAVETWLEGAPGGPVAADSDPGRQAVEAIVEGWASRLMRALATRPLPLSELGRTGPGEGRPAPRQALTSTQRSGLVEVRTGPDGDSLYALTDWGRRAVAPLARASRCERFHLPAASAAATPADFETALLLAIPLTALPADAAGWCQLRVAVGRQLGIGASVTVKVKGGRIVEAGSRLEMRPREWAAGSERCWFEAISRGDPGRLQIGGGEGLAESLVRGLHEALVPTSSTG